MTRTWIRSRASGVARWTIAALLALLILGSASASLAIGSVGYFDAYCVTKLEASEFNHIRGPSYDVLGRTVTCHFAVTMDEIASGDTTDIVYEDSFPLIGSVAVLGSALILTLLVGNRILRWSHTKRSASGADTGRDP